MNYCRECNKIIPRIVNGGPALRCSECRAEKDFELADLIHRNQEIESNFDGVVQDAKRYLMRNKLLRQRNQVLLNDNHRLEAENEKLSKGVERLFAKIEKLEKLLSDNGIKYE